MFVSKSNPQLLVRYLGASDIPAATAIARKTIAPFLKAGYFEQLLRHKDHAGFIVGYGIPLGYLVYQRSKTCIAIRELAVHPDHQRKGLGRELIEFVVRRLDQQKLDKLEVIVPESNLVACKFFRSMGFRAYIPIQKD